MGARELFERIEKERWSVVSEWLREGATESVFLDFKQAEKSSGFRASDAANLATGISGFANVEGGLLVFGIMTTKDAKGVDRVSAVQAFDSLDFAAEVEKRILNCSDPKVPGVHAVRVENPATPSAGVVVVIIPASDGGPHRALGAGSDSDKYYMRTSTSTTVMPHAVLAAMFGRRPPPKLRLRVHREGTREIGIVVENRGRGSARAICLRIGFERSGASIVASDPSLTHTWVRINTGGLRPPRIRLHGSSLLYPDDEQRVMGLAVHTDLDPTCRIVGRIDCEGAQPVQFDGPFPVGGDPVFIPEEPS